jgi:hypothetical protein
VDWVNPRAIVWPKGLSMKNSSDTIGNWSCVLLVCSTVPHRNAPQCIDNLTMSILYYQLYIILRCITAHYIVLYICLCILFMPCVIFCVFVFYSSVILCNAWYVYISVLHNCCAIIHCHNDMFHILIHADCM